MPFHPMWLPPPWWVEFPPHDERATLVQMVENCLQGDGGFGNWPASESYLECCFQAFAALNALDAVAQFKRPGVEEFLNSRASAGGGFADLPGGKPTLFNTFYGVICCNMLEVPLPHGMRDVEFIARHRVSGDAGNEVAYACAEGWVPELLATYWAVAALNSLRALPPDDADGVARFIDSCWDQEAGGYGASPGHPAYMEYTYCALAIAVLLDLPLPAERSRAAIEFVASAFDRETALFGESPAAPGTLGDSLWAAACLAMLGATDAADLRSHRRLIETFQPSQLWHLHCKLLIESYLDQRQVRLSDSVINAEHVSVPGGYAFVARSMKSSSVSGTPQVSLDLTDRTLAEISGLLDELDRTLRSQRSEAEKGFDHLLRQLSLEVTGAFLPTGKVPDTRQAFMELVSEPELLSIPMELALVDDLYLGAATAVGRLVRAGSPPPHQGDDLQRAGSRVLLLGASHPAGEQELPGVNEELEEVAATLQRVQGVTVRRIEGPELVRAAVREALSESGRGWDVIHLAGHSFAPSGYQHDVRSGVLLADGELELRLLLEWCGEYVPRLIFVHACTSSKSTLQREGIARLANRGMAVTAAEAGVAYIGSYWSVCDQLSAIFARAFYDLLSRGFPTGEAIRLARAKLRWLGAGPSAWAGYCLIGPPRQRIAPYEWRSLGHPAAGGESQG